MNLTIEDKLDLLAELLYRLHELHSTGAKYYGMFKVSDNTYFEVRDTPWTYLEIEVRKGQKSHSISFNAYDYKVERLNGWYVTSYSYPKTEISSGIPYTRYDNLSVSIIRKYIENIPTVTFVDAFIKGLKILLAYTD